MSFSIQKWNWLQRFSKKLSLVSQLETGDSSFDREFLVVSENEELTKALFQSEETRNAIRQVFSHGFHRITCNGKELAVLGRPWELKLYDIANFKPSSISDASLLLERLVQSLKNHGSRFLDHSFAKNFARVFLSLIPFLLFFTCFWFWFRKSGQTLDILDLYWSSLGTSILIAAGYSIVFIRTFRKTLYFAQIIPALIIFGILFLCSGAATKECLNAQLDDATPTLHESLVINKKTAKNKKKTRFLLDIESWRPGHRLERLEISASIYGEILPNRSKIMVSTKPGFFGYEWVESYSIKR